MGHCITAVEPEASLGAAYQGSGLTHRRLDRWCRRVPGGQDANPWTRTKKETKEQKDEKEEPLLGGSGGGGGGGSDSSMAE